MTQDLNASRKAIVTGGSAGIGYAIAEQLLQQGHHVFICARNSEKLEQALCQLKAIGNGHNIAGVVCDVRRFPDVQNMVNAAQEFMGGIDVLVNNAGQGVVASFEDMSVEDWQSMMDTNLTGVFNCCKAALPALKKSEFANIINLGSRAGRYAFPGGTAYNATKSGLQGFSEALFLDLSKYQIGVSLVAPGTVATELSGSTEKWHLQPGDIAKVVTDLLTNNSRANVNWIEVRPGRPC